MKTRFIKLSLLLLTGLSIISISLNAAAKSAKDQEGMTLYTISDDISHINNSGYSRGMRMDKQDLGIVMTASSTLTIRQTNPNFKHNLTLQLLNDNQHNEKDHNIPQYGSEVTIDVLHYSVPLIKTPIVSTTEKPSISFTYTGEVFKLPVYNQGDDVTSFFTQWDMDNSTFALLKSSRTDILVHDINKDYLRHIETTGRDFHSIDEILQAYIDLQDFYDMLNGLDGSTSYNQNVIGKYFVKSDVRPDGGFAGYYNAGTHVAIGSTSLQDGILDKVGWIMLHEIGHGYEGNFSNTNLDNSMRLNEMWNNIYSLTLDSILEGHKSDWLYRGNRLEIDQDIAYKINNGSTYYTIGNPNDTVYWGSSERLYFFMQLIESLGYDFFIHFNQEYRRMVHEKDSFIKDYANTDMFVKLFGEPDKVNLIAYFEYWGLEIDPTIKDYLYAQNYENIYILNQLVKNENTLDRLVRKYELPSRYSLIKTSDLKDEGIVGNLNVEFEIDNINSLLGKEYILKDGENIVSQGKLASNNLSLNNLPVGAYSLITPNATDSAYEVFDITVLVKENEETSYTVNYKKINESSDVVLYNKSIDLLGYGDKKIAQVDISDNKNEVTITTLNAGQPHTGWPNKRYISIEILDENDNQKYYREYFGNIDCISQVEKIDVQGNYKIRIFHAEPRYRRVFMDNLTKQKDDTFASVLTNTTVTIAVSYDGIYPADFSAEQITEAYENRYENIIARFISLIPNESIFQNNTYKYSRNHLHAIILSLPDKAKEHYLSSLNNIIFGESSVPEPQPDTTQPDKTPTIVTPIVLVVSGMIAIGGFFLILQKRKRLN